MISENFFKNFVFEDVGLVDWKLESWITRTTVQLILMGTEICNSSGVVKWCQVGAIQQTNIRNACLCAPTRLV